MALPTRTDEAFRAEYEAAVEAERIADLTEPRAKSAHYDPETRRIVVELKLGSAIAFPTSLYPDLDRLTPEQLATMELDPGGEALLWEEYDVGYEVAGIIVDILGDAMLRAFASRGGSSRSERKAAAARQNGRKGGRPKKKRPAPAQEPAAT